MKTKNIKKIIKNYNNSLIKFKIIAKKMFSSKNNFFYLNRKLKN